MVKGLIVGGLAFGAIMLVERQFGALAKDIERYNRIRAMSDDPSLLKQGINAGLELLHSFGNSQRGGALDVLHSLQSDVMRYARISSM